jgi:hypothetical protein
MTNITTLDPRYILTVSEPTITDFLDLLIKSVNSNVKYANAFITIINSINQDNAPITSFQSINASEIIIYASRIDTAGIIKGTFNTKHSLKDVLRDFVVTSSVLSGYNNDDWSRILSHIYFAYLRVYFRNSTNDESDFQKLLSNQWLVGILFMEIIYMYQPNLYTSYMRNNETT